MANPTWHDDPLQAQDNAPSQNHTSQHKKAWLKNIEKRLAAQGLPSAYIRRFMDELSDHLADIEAENLMEENGMITNVNDANIGIAASVVPVVNNATAAKTIEPTTRLGDAADLADAAVVTYRRRNFLGRHPLAAFGVFVLSPILGYVAVIALFLLAAGLLVDRFDHTTVDQMIKQFAPIFRDFCLVATVIAPSIFMVAFYCKLARRLCLGWKWMLASCIVVSLLAAGISWSFKFSDIPGNSAIMCGLGLPTSIRQWIQLAIPLALGVWFLFHRHRVKPQSLAAS
jgi:hypothetical protein